MRRVIAPFVVVVVCVAVAVPMVAAKAAAMVPTAGSVVVNEVNAINNAAGGDWFELLVKVDGLDLRGLRITDNPFVSGTLKGGESVYVLGQDPFLEKVPGGTIIAVYTLAAGVATDTRTDAAAGDRSLTLAPGTGVTKVTDGLGGAPATGLSTTGDSLTVYLPGPDGDSAGSDNVYLDFMSWMDDGSDPAPGLPELNLFGVAVADAVYGCTATRKSALVHWRAPTPPVTQASGTPGRVNPGQDLSACISPKAVNAPAPARPPLGDTVSFNEYNAEDSGGKVDFVELLVREDADLRGVRISDNEIQGDGSLNRGESVIVLGQDAFLAKVPAWTTVAILIEPPSDPKDLDTTAGGTDYRMVLAPGTGVTIGNDGLGGKVEVGFGEGGDALYLYTVAGTSAGTKNAYADYVSWKKDGASPPPGFPDIQAPTKQATSTASCGATRVERATRWVAVTVPTLGDVNPAQDFTFCRSGSTAVGDPLPGTSKQRLVYQLLDTKASAPTTFETPRLEIPITLPDDAHNNGMAVTGSGQIIGNYKLSDTEGQIHVFAKGTGWVRNRFDFTAQADGENRWPSGMQAAGQILAVVDNKYAGFFRVYDNGAIADLGQWFAPPEGTTAESIGFAYHPVLKRYYVVFPGKDTVYASPRGEPFVKKDGTRNPKFEFSKIASTGTISSGEAGLALLHDPSTNELIVISLGTKGAGQATTFGIATIDLDVSGTKATISGSPTRTVPSASRAFTFGPSFRWGATATIVNGQVRLWAMPRRQTHEEQLFVDPISPAYWDF